MKQNKTSEAKSCLDTVKKILHKNIEVVIDKSNVLCEMGRTEESIECIDLALKLNPDDMNLLSKKEEILNKYGKTTLLAS